MLGKVILGLNVLSAGCAFGAALFWYRASSFPKDVFYDGGEIGSDYRNPDPNEFHNVMENQARNNGRGALLAASAALLQGSAMALGLF
ncbi:MAG: hypothetical protein J0L51_05135 [Rhizobiales bacterium]|nr:hypothetical protein [Hyphomicrobiales bacterium]